MKARQIVEWARRSVERTRRLVEWGRRLVEQALQFVKDCIVALRDATQAFFDWIVQGVEYSILFVWTVLCSTLLFMLTIAPIGLPVLALAGLLAFWPEVEKAIQFEDTRKEIAGALSLLIGVGLFSWITTKLGQYAWDQFVKICKAAKSVLVDVWNSDWRSRKGLETAWRKYVSRKRREDLWSAFKDARRLTISLMSCVLLVALYATFGPKQTKAPEQTRDPEQTESIVQTIYRYVAVVDAEDSGPEMSREIRLFLKSGAVFYLAHVKNAQPKEGEGICLGEPQQKWLEEFRKAIENCMEEKKPTDGDSKPVFKVTGYASIAPMHAEGDNSVSPELNCKVANWRAAAVGDYLINPTKERANTRWRCADVKRAFNRDEPNENECGEHYVPKNQDSNPFLVEVRQWRKPSEMIENKPANDGERPSPRRYDVEIMNRVVSIEVPSDFCDDILPGLPAP